MLELAQRYYLASRHPDSAKQLYRVVEKFRLTQLKLLGGRKTSCNTPTSAAATRQAQHGVE